MDEQQQGMAHLRLDPRCISPPFQNEIGAQDPTHECYELTSAKIQSEFKSSASANTNNNNNHVALNCKKGFFTQSRSIESLLSSNVNTRGNMLTSMQNNFYSENEVHENADDGTYANLDEIRYHNNPNEFVNSKVISNENRIDTALDEPFYETADFVRASRERMSDNTFSRKSTAQFFHSVSMILNLRFYSFGM